MRFINLVTIALVFAASFLQQSYAATNSPFAAPSTTSGANAAAAQSVLASQPNSIVQIAPPAALMPTNGQGARILANEQLPEEKARPSDFQSFVKQSIGVDLPVYGHTLFKNVPTTFAPVENIPVPPDYVIGPGDEIQVRAWGQVDIDVRAIVDRVGSLYIPKVGNINVAGLKYADLSDFLKTAVGRLFRNFDLSANLGQLRSIQVFVVGHARRPGTYTVSSLSTLVNTVFAAGGPAATGSMRHVQLKRGNQTITVLDMYNLLLNGDMSADAKLLPGDVIFFSPIGPTIAVSGSVNVPAIYELAGPTSLSDVFAWTGGLTNTAGASVHLERVENHQQRTVLEVQLTKAGLSTALRDADIIRVRGLSSRFENTVTLRGNVAEPSRVEWTTGMRIKDLIPDTSFLISSNYWQSKSPGINTLGGNATTIQSEIKNSLSEVNWDYAVIERLNWQELTTTLIPFNLAKAVKDADPKHNILLEAGDVVTIFSKNDVQVPIAKRSTFVTIEGEVAAPGVYQITPGVTLQAAVNNAGGVTDHAYLFGARLTRESTRLLQQKQMEEAVSRLEREMERDAAFRSRSVLSAEDASAVQSEAVTRRNIVERLKGIKATGRIVLEIPTQANKNTDIPDIVLEDADRLYIPSAPSTVGVLGAVYNENTFLHRNGKELSDYIAQAGGPTKNADNREAYVLRADGSTVSRRQSGWFGSGFENLDMMPGDTVVVPEDLEKTSWAKVLKDWTQILYQFGLGAAAIKVLNQ